MYSSGKYVNYTLENRCDLDNNMGFEETVKEANGTEVNNIEDISARKEVKEIISKSQNGIAPGKDNINKEFINCENKDRREDAAELGDWTNIDSTQKRRSTNN
ncbi:hypothetical protein Trydic_g22158 [Trypoxylus dichotomus]